MVTRAPRLLVKARPVPAGAAFNLGKIPFRLDPLFPGRAARAEMGAAASPEWHITDIPHANDEADLWDLCHQLHSQGFGIAGGPAVEFAEPDLQQQWVFDAPERVAGKAFRAVAAADACTRPDPPDARFPFPKPFDWRWFQGDQFSGLDAARSQIG